MKIKNFEGGHHDDHSQGHDHAAPSMKDLFKARLKANIIADHEEVEITEEEKAKNERIMQHYRTCNEEPFNSDNIIKEFNI